MFITTDTHNVREVETPPGPGKADLSLRVMQYLERLQSTICTALEELDGTGTFGRDPWERSGGGGGLTRILEDGSIFEKAGVSV